LVLAAGVLGLGLILVAAAVAAAAVFARDWEH